MKDIQNLNNVPMYDYGTIKIAKEARESLSQYVSEQYIKQNEEEMNLEK